MQWHQWYMKCVWENRIWSIRGGDAKLNLIRFAVIDRCSCMFRLRCVALWMETLFLCGDLFNSFFFHCFWFLPSSSRRLKTTVLLHVVNCHIDIGLLCYTMPWMCENNATVSISNDKRKNKHNDSNNNVSHNRWLVFNSILFRSENKSQFTTTTTTKHEETKSRFEFLSTEHRQIRMRSIYVVYYRERNKYCAFFFKLNLFIWCV